MSDSSVRIEIYGRIDLGMVKDTYILDKLMDAIDEITEGHGTFRTAFLYKEQRAEIRRGV